MNCQRCGALEAECGDMYSFIQVVICNDCENEWQRICRIDSTMLEHERITAEREILFAMGRAGLNEVLIERYVGLHAKLSANELKIIKFAREWLKNE